MMTPICFYHKADLDGVCSAAIVRKHSPECELYGIDYGESFPWDKVQPKADGTKRDVVMVDFSLPAFDMDELRTLGTLYWLDHHKSAIEACSPNIYGERNAAFSACELAWAWFFPNTPIPASVHLLGRYDVWAKNDPDWESRILPFQYGCRVRPGIYDPTTLVWLGILGGNAPDGSNVIPANTDAVIQTGQDILAYVHQERAEWAKRAAFECGEILHADGHVVSEMRFLCINSQGNNSVSLECLWNAEKHDAMCVFFQRKDGKWQHGFYSTKQEVDCSAIAKCFGGGGHRGAAGCIVERPLVKP